MVIADPLEVLLLAEDPLVRSGLRNRLSALDALRIAGDAESFSDAAPLLLRQEIDAILWDLGLRGEALLSKESGSAENLPPVVALVADGRGARAVRAQGLAGAISRAAEGSKIFAALQAVTQGLWVEEESFAASSSATFEPNEAEELTPREREVLALLAEGLANKEIANRLRMSEHTAKFHVNAIMGKLGVTKRTEAVVHAARLGWIRF